MINNQDKNGPVVWAISGSDSCGGTGIQSDLQTFRDFSVHGCSVITQLAAQNSFARGYTVATERKSIVAQINALDSDVPATVIKLGALPNKDAVEVVVKYLDDYDGYVVYDLELEASGEALLTDAEEVLRHQLLPRVNLLVVNVAEAKALTSKDIDSPETMVAAAQALLGGGSIEVLITGAQFDGAQGQRFDYWASADESLWVTINELATVNNRGGGSALSAGIAAAKARGLSMEEALRLSKAYVTQGIRGASQIGSGPGAVAHLGWPEDEADMPVLSKQAPEF